jgi:predicted dehydrogenase
MSAKPGRLGVGLVGSGFMGRAHAFAFHAVSQIFDLPLKPALAVLADQNEAQAGEAARRLGFAKAVTDWRALVDDPAVDVVSITTPNHLHNPIALAALQAGKAVYCEKPLAATLADAKQMAEAARLSGQVTLVGFNYLKNPIIGLVREIATSGEIGEIVAFRGIHAEDYMCDPAAPHSFRTDPAGGGGVLMDLGSHIVSLARHLVGPIAEVSAAAQTVHKVRPSSSGPRLVEVDDHGHFVARFENGALGTITASWVTPGRKMQLELELVGTRGSIAFSQERFNEVRLYVAGEGRQGFKTLVSGPDVQPYGNFCPAPGHQLGFNDLKTIEVAHLIDAIATGKPATPDFEEAYEIQRAIGAALRSSEERAWVKVESVYPPLTRA